MIRRIIRHRRSRNIVGIWHSEIENHLKNGKTVSSTRYANKYDIIVREDHTYVMQGDIPFSLPEGIREINGTWEISLNGDFILNEMGVSKKARINVLNHSSLSISFQGEELEHLFQYKSYIEDGIDTVVLSFIRVNK